MEKNIEKNVKVNKGKNHWTKSNVDKATIKINKEIYKRNRQSSLQLKLDDMAILINDKITRRGIAKGMVFVQEDLNKNILLAEKKTVMISYLINIEEQIKCIKEIKKILKINVWSDIRFLMINKAITPGEITELIRRQMEIDKELERWEAGLSNAISANR